MTINFNGGIHEVVIYKDGKRHDITTFPEMFQSIASVSVRFGNELLGTIEVQFTPSLKDGLKILASGLLGIGLSEKGQEPETKASAASGSAVTAKKMDDTVSASASASSSAGSDSTQPILAVRFLYPGQTDNDGTEASTPWFSGGVNVPSVSINSTEISITMKAASNAVSAAKFIATASFKDITIYNVILKLIEPFGMVITFDEDDLQTESIIKEKTYSGISSEPPMTTIKNILLTADCFFSLINGDDKNPQNQIRIKSRKSVNEGKIDFTFVLYRQIDPANNIIPLYDFQVQSNGALFLSGGAFGSAQTGVDPTTKKATPLKVDDKSNKTKGLTAGKAGMGKIPAKSGVAAGTQVGLSPSSEVVMSGDNIGVNQRGTQSNKPEIEAKALKDGSLGLAYTLTVPGLPRLRAMRLAQVIIGDSIPGISGPGQIYWVTHRTGSDGWISEIEFKRQPGLIDGVSLDKRGIETSKITSSGTSRLPTNIA